MVAGISPPAKRRCQSGGRFKKLWKLSDGLIASSRGEGYAIVSFVRAISVLFRLHRHSKHLHLLSVVNKQNFLHLYLTKLSNIPVRCISVTENLKLVG